MPRPEFWTPRRRPSFDAITRLCAEYFKADTVLLGFADESRVWIKSYWGEPVRELPRQHSIFEMVLAEDGPVVVPDINDDPDVPRAPATAPPARCGFLRERSCTLSEGKILGTLTIFSCQPRRAMAVGELRMLESLADIVASQLELRRMRKALNAEPSRSRQRTVEPVTGIWPRKSGSAAGAREAASLCCITSRRSSLYHAAHHWP